LTNSHLDQTNHQTSLYQPGDGIGSLHFATNARDQAVIMDGRQRGTSVLLAFDKAWHKASESKSE
jgi:hypothetical protein